MSPRERIAWIQLATILVVFIPHFTVVLHIVQGGGPIARPLLIAFMAAIGVHLVVTVAAQIALAIRNGAPIADERDAVIEAKSLRAAYFMLVTLVMIALPTIAFWGAILLPSTDAEVRVPGFAVFAELVFLCFVITEAARYAVQAFCYRRDAVA